MSDSSYKPADYVAGQGWVCKRQRIRQPREFKEEDLRRLVCKKYHDGKVNPDTFYPSLIPCGIDVTVWLNTFAAMEEGQQRAIFQYLSYGGFNGKNAIDYLDSYEHQLSVLNVIFTDERSRFYQKTSGFCAAAAALDWLLRNFATAMRVLAAMDVILIAVAALFPPLAPAIGGIVLLSAGFVVFMNRVASSATLINDAVKFIFWWLGCSPLDIPSLGKPEDVPTVRAEDIKFPDMLP